MLQDRPALRVALILVLTGCSGVQRTVEGWLDSDTAAPGTSVSGVYFAGHDGLVVHADASASSAVVGHLALYEKVVRSKLRSGYAHVVAEKSGLEGWVDNADLVWRVPGTTTSTSESGSGQGTTSPAVPVTGATSAAEASAGAGAEAASSDGSDDTPAGPDEALPAAAPPDEAPEEPDSEPPAPVPVASPQPDRPTPDIFDPF